MDRRIRLLLIEDQLSDQLLFKRYVQRRQLPYDFEIAASFAEAANMLESGGYDLVLADHDLGDGTTFDLFPLIPPTLPVIVVTGSGNEEIAVKALKLGAADYLTKDLDGDYLKLLPMVIDNVLKAKAAEKELEIYQQQLESLVEERTEALRQEISERMSAEARLKQEKERAEITLKSIGDAVITTDQQGRVEFLNPVAEKLTGWSNEEAKGIAIDQVFCIFDESSRMPIANPILRCLQSNDFEYMTSHILLIDRDGNEYSIQDSAAPIHDNDGDIQGGVLVFSDVSETKRMEQELAYQASHDALTGLLNRRAFESHLKQVLSTRHMLEQDNAFCYLDLDQFKVINDIFGHTAGDELLKQITSIIKQKVRSGDMLARLGGDEFGLLMVGCSIKQAESLANLLREEIAGYRFHWQDKTVSIGVSIGLIEITEDVHSLNDLLIIADSCCYAAKDSGRNQVRVYQQDDELIRSHSSQMQWVARLHDALDNDHFKLYRQTIRCLSGSEGGHFEVLLRIVDRKGKIIQPGAFIPAAERYGLMDKIDLYVVWSCLSWFAEHQAELDGLSLCTINLSGQTLGIKAALESIQRELDYFGLPGEKFCFEVTETAAISNLSMATDFINSLKHKGYRFALDDFGSGLSSFAYLKNLDVDFLKIDGSFVRNICNDPVDLAMVRSINEIGRLMGKKTIAEFIENENIFNAVQNMGVDYAQGYWIGRPRPFED